MWLFDLHGTLVVHQAPEEYGEDLIPLKGAVEKTRSIYPKKIVIVTGMPCGYRRFLEEQLTRLGFCFDDLILGAGSGPRYLVNDLKPASRCIGETAIAINRQRNQEWTECE